VNAKGQPVTAARLTVQDFANGTAATNSDGVFEIAKRAARHSVLCLFARGGYYGEFPEISANQDPSPRYASRGKIVACSENYTLQAGFPAQFHPPVGVFPLRYSDKALEVASHLGLDMTYLPLQLDTRRAKLAEKAWDAVPVASKPRSPN